MKGIKKQWAKAIRKTPFRRRVEDDVNDDVAFLCLPYDIRYRIYVLAGLVRDCPIDLNRPAAPQTPRISRISCSHRTIKGPRTYREVTRPVRWDAVCECDPVPIQLLQICRAVSRECSLIFYSENDFKICRIGYRGFKPIHRMTKSTLSAITSLSVRLNTCLCCLKITRDKNASNGRFHTCTGGVRGFDEEALAQWQSLCELMSANIEPSRLAVRIICDTENHEIAHKVVQAFSNLPTLRSCSIRFSQDPNPKLGPLARKAVRQATRPPPSSRESLGPGREPARKISLPWEIQRQILAHHPYLVPDHALQWHPVDKFTRRECCGSCTDSPEACCCSGKQSAFSDACTCWVLPAELFLINSSWQQAATEIFFQQNHFAVLSNEENGRLPAAPALFEFLSVIPRHALQHIRSIECIFPQLSEARAWGQGERGHLYWIKGINMLAQNLRVDRLTLSLNLSADAYHWRHLDHLVHLGHGTLQDVINILDDTRKNYQQAVSPLTDLGPKGNLANFFVRAGFEDGSENEEMEALLESQVMGEDYDSILKGKNNDPRLWATMEKCCWERPEL